MKTSSSSDLSPALRPRASDRNIILAAKGGGIAFAGTLFAYAGRMVISILLARFLGAEQYGLYDLALIAASTAAGLAMLGLRSALVRYISLFASRRDTAGLWGTLQVGLGVVMVMSLPVGVGLYALANPIAERLFHEPSLASLLRLASLMVPLLALNDILGAATRGFKRVEYSVLTEQITRPLTRVILIVVLAVVVGLDAIKALAVHIFALIVACALLLYFLNRLFPLKRPLRLARRNFKEMLAFGLPVHLSSLIRTFGGNIQTVLIGTLDTIATVGIFAVASRVNMIGKAFHQSIVTASMPIVSELHERGEREPLVRFYQIVTKWTFTLNLPLFLTVLLFSGPILAIFGKEFVGGAQVLAVLAWANLVDAGTGICGVVLEMAGRTSLKLMNSIILFVLTLGLNALLIPRWGVMGAATASLVAIAVKNLLLLMQVYVLFRMLPYSAGFIKPVAAGGITLAAVLIIRRLLPVQTGLVYLAIGVSLLFAVYVGVVLLLGLSLEDRAVLLRLRARAKIALSKG